MSPAILLVTNWYSVLKKSHNSSNIFQKMSTINSYYWPRSEKTCLLGLRTTKAQTDLESFESKLLQVIKIAIFELVSVAEETGLSLAL